MKNIFRMRLFCIQKVLLNGKYSSWNDLREAFHGVIGVILFLRGASSFGIYEKSEIVSIFLDKNSIFVYTEMRIMGCRHAYHSYSLQTQRRKYDPLYCDDMAHCQYMVFLSSSCLYLYTVSWLIKNGVTHFSWCM